MGILNSPLVIGCDVRNMTEETRRILLNREVIAVNQDVSGRQPYRAGGIHSITGVNHRLLSKIAQ